MFMLYLASKIIQPSYAMNTHSSIWVLRTSRLTSNLWTVARSLLGRQLQPGLNAAYFELSNDGTGRPQIIYQEPRKVQKCQKMKDISSLPPKAM
jgi:hypothetical protein